MTYLTDGKLQDLFPGWSHGRRGIFSFNDTRPEVEGVFIFDTEKKTVFLLTDTEAGDECSTRYLTEFGKRYSWGVTKYNRLVRWLSEAEVMAGSEAEIAGSLASVGCSLLLV